MLGRISLLALLIAAGATPALAGGEANWSYGGATGPDKWGELAREWEVCSKGRHQSPIDIRGAVGAPFARIEARIEPTPLAFALGGPTFAVPYAAGSELTINGMRYRLQQFHFHHPSEHTREGNRFAMEAHLVLRSERSTHDDAVLGIFISEGKENPMLKQFWDKLPRSAKKNIEGVSVNVGDLLPRDTDYYMYEGSMTTPGCGEGVRWFVLEHSVEASKQQVDRFVSDSTEGTANNRPIQPTHGRVIVESD